MRLFIAIELPDDARRHLVRVRDVIKHLLRDSRASFTRDEKLHITLKFLGEVDDQTLAKVSESLAMVRIDGEIRLYAQKVECFPPRGPVRIIAAGFGGSDAALTALHRAIEQRCQHLGFERETRAYRPHVTLARARPTLPPAVRSRCEAATAAKFPGPECVVERFTLFQSLLHPSGSQYVALGQFDL